MDGTTTNTNTTVTEAANAAVENVSKRDCGGDPQKAVNSEKSEKAVSTSETAATSTPGTGAKTFTQKELDEIVKQRVERAKKGMPSAEEMKAFKEWQDSQKTAEQISAEKIAAAENAMTEAVRRAEAAEAKASALSKGVSPDAVEDVIALAISRCEGKVSDDTDISAAIDAVIAKYPSFCKAASEAPKGVTTGVNFQSGGNANMSGVEAAFFAKNPELRI